MLAFFLVIALIAGFVNVAFYFVETQRIDTTLDSIINYDAYRPRFDGRGRNDGFGGGGPGGDGFGPDGNGSPDSQGGRDNNGFGPDDNGRGPDDQNEMEQFMALPNEEENYMIRFFIVTLDEENEIVESSLDFIASVDESDLASYTSSALARKSDRGYVNGYRYARSYVDGATIITFLNCERELSSMRTILAMTLAISGVSLILVFVLVLLFSKKAIQPIAQNIEIQKRFITDAGHELKTPLTSISTSLDVIEIDKGEDEWTQNIRSQVGRMTGLVGELVALSKLDEVKPVPDKENFDLTGAAWEILEVHTPQAKARGKSIETDIQDGITLFGEKASIQQMLSVLIDNAIKYSSDDAAIRFTIKRSKNKIRIEVFNPCDYAKAPDTERLFDRFYRPDESRNTSTGGNGIGLAIAKAVVEAHGGKISAKCPDGKSMTITVEL